jgi:sugar transferase (PEP-CTERM system associated)
MSLLRSVMNSPADLDLPTDPSAIGPVQPQQTNHTGFLTLKRRVLILGVGPLAGELSRVLRSKRGHFTEVIGFLDKDMGRTHLEEWLVTPGIIGSYAQLSDIVKRYQVSTIAVCLEDRRAFLPVEVLLDMKVKGTDVIDGNKLIEEESGRLSIDHIKPSTLIFSNGFHRSKLAMMIKRLSDIVLPVVGLVFLSPLFALLAALIKLDSPGPVFYRQTRVGLGGQPYEIWKFRTMCQDAEKNGARWASENDPRISRVGRWMRKYRFDELPQLINVLKGEMSLVGPRPERPIFVSKLREQIPYYDLRHTVRPGITGWAQTQFRYGASVEDSHIKLQYDLYYVKNFSLALDARIIAYTIGVVLSRDGAR